MIAKWQPKVHPVPRRVAINFSDPLGRGWNVFGSAEMGVNSAIFNHPTAIAVVQVCAIVGGHVFGVVCAHEKAVALLPPDPALRGRLPPLLLLVMIGYTCAGLSPSRDAAEISPSGSSRPSTRSPTSSGLPASTGSPQEYNAPARSLYDTVAHRTSFVVYVTQPGRARQSASGVPGFTSSTRRS